MPDPRNLPDMPALMIPGPGEVQDEELKILGRQLIAHYGDTWQALHEQAIADVGKLLGASDLPYLIPGTGTTCLEAAVVNLFDPGQKVVIVNSGFFGIRLREIAMAHRLEFEEVPVAPGELLDLDRVANAVKGADGLLSVHVETATGTRLPIEDLAKIARDADVLYMVDGIASVGGELLNVDDMGIDVVVTGTQKGLETPPGLGVIAFSAKGRSVIESRTEPLGSWYLDIKRWDWYRKEWPHHPHPVTMPTNLVLAVASSTKRILETGLEAWVGRRADLAKRLREGLNNLGLAPVAPPGFEANLVTASWSDDPNKIIGYLLQNGIQISAGLEPTTGKVIRVGLMGATATDEMVDKLLGLVGQALN
jgi:alanine-glyoxylate transaminase/serine-glyoxylate transaminase/serine-pyruvate transaminase